MTPTSPESLAHEPGLASVAVSRSLRIFVCAVLDKRYPRVADAKGFNASLHETIKDLNQNQRRALLHIKGDGGTIQID